MASILDASLSSDSEDTDYVPPTGKNADCSSSDEDSVDELDENAEHKNKKRRVEKSPEKTTNPVVDKQKREDVWKSFKDLVAQSEKGLSKASESPKTDDVSTTVPVEKSNDELNCKDDELKCKHDEKAKDEEKKVAPVFEFAGETFTVKDSKICETHVSCLKPPLDVKKPPLDVKKPPLDVKKPLENAASTSRKKGGLGSLIGSLTDKKKKLTVLEKTQLDWKSFTEENELDEELKHHRIGKDSFIERQRFLERSDFRSFDIEKNLRQLTRNKK